MRAMHVAGLRKAFEEQVSGVQLDLRDVRDKDLCDAVQLKHGEHRV